MPPRLPAGSLSISPAALADIRLKQIRAGPGVPIASNRKDGIICNNVICPKTLKFWTNASGERLWSPQQAFFLKKRNSPRLEGLTRRQQLSALKRWFESRADTREKRRRLADEANANQEEILRKLREEEVLKRDHRISFTFIGSARAFWSCPSNFCRFYELAELSQSQALHRIASRRYRKFVSDKRKKDEGTAATRTATKTKRKRKWRRSKVVLDRTTLNLFQRSGDFTCPMKEADVDHWWHRGLLQFQKMDPEMQSLFSAKPNERLSWLEPNSNYSLWMRWYRRARALPEYDELRRRRDTATLMRVLALRYQQASVSELMELLDTSHTAKFPLIHVKAQW
jgi:hypothetical protein